MKTKIWLFAAAALSFAACSQNDNITEQLQEPVVSFDDFEAPDGRVVVQIGTRNALVDSNISQTRTPAEKIDALYEKMGIFVMTDNASDWSTGDNLLLNNIQATYGNTVNQENGAEENGVYRIKLKTPNQDGFNGVYFYPMNNNPKYSFYGYYPYNQNNTVSAGNSKITFSNFTANTDILWAKNEATTIQKSELVAVPGAYQDMESFDGYNARYLRVLKYHNSKCSDENQGVKKPYLPNLKFNHQLTLLKICLKPSKDIDESELDDFYALNQSIRAIKIKNQPKDLNLDMLTGEISGSSETQDLGAYLMSNDGTWFQEVAAPDETKFPIAKGREEQAVVYFLVKPADSYEFTLTICWSQASVPQESVQKVTINAQGAVDGDTFGAGKSYKIKLGFLKAQEVESTVSLSPWGPDEVVEFPVN